MLQNKSTWVGSVAPDFRLADQNGVYLSLYEVLAATPVLLVFYPGDFTSVCTKQLCNYRDNMEAFTHMGLRLIGVSGNPVDQHADFAAQYSFRFPLLSDPGQEVAKAYGCTSLMMFGGVSRAVFIISKSRAIAYRYVEPTILTRRKADELLHIAEDLKNTGRI